VNSCVDIVRDLSPRFLLFDIALFHICRLSDYLFTVARYACMKEGQHEHIYRKV